MASYREYLSYEDAREYVQEQHLFSMAEFFEWSSSGHRPKNIPSTPQTYYKGKGWVSPADFLGLQQVRRVNINEPIKIISNQGKAKNFLPFEEARAFVHGLNLKGYKDWAKYCQEGLRPDNIPRSPNEVYKDKGWLSWPDWTNNGYALPVKKTIDIKDTEDKTNTNNNSNTEIITKEANKGGRKKCEYVTYEEAREFVHNVLKITNKAEWIIYRKSEHRHPNIPFKPNIAYKDNGWTSWNDWYKPLTQKEKIQKRKDKREGKSINIKFKSPYLSYKKARDFARSLKLKDKKDWEEYVANNKLPMNIPKEPHKTYKDNGWISSWTDWLDSALYTQLDVALKLMKDNYINNYEQYLELRNTYPELRLPEVPQQIYKRNKDWVGIKNFYSKEVRPDYVTLPELKNIINKHKLEWEIHDIQSYQRFARANKHLRIPINPLQFYGKLAETAKPQE